MTVKAVITSGIGFEAGANRLFTQKIIDYLPVGSFITPAKRRHRAHGRSILFAITPNFNNFHHASGICPRCRRAARRRRIARSREGARGRSGKPEAQGFPIEAESLTALSPEHGPRATQALR